MQIILCCTILFSLISNKLCTGQKQNKAWNITFDPPEVTAVSGVCALISCTFTYSNKAKPIHYVKWLACKNGQCEDEVFKAEASRNTENKLEEDESKTGQIEMLEPDLNKTNCSIIMRDIKAEDQMEYSFRVEGPNSQRNTYKTRVKIIIQDEPIMDIPLLSEGEEANLTCSAPFPCPEAPPEIKWWIRTRRGNITDLKDNIITLTTSKSLYLSTLTLPLTSDLHNATVGCDVSYGSKNISTNRTLEVMYVKTLEILGNGKLQEGDTLSLSCTVESHPPSSDPVWRFSGTTDSFMNQTSAESLTITNVTQEHAGVYICMRTYGNKTLNTSFTISVIHEKNKIFSPGGENMLKPLNITIETTDKAAFQLHVDIKMITACLTGISISAVIFSVVLCCQESWKSKDKTHEEVATNTYTKVVLEVFPGEYVRTYCMKE